MRKWREENQVDHKPAYFTEKRIPEHPDRPYFIYNGEYWENDRKHLDWSRLPDIFTDKMPFDN